ncbi:MAG: M23 family metallopeptidase [Verrucomicrobiae bacterium]|nr:M23 family metallopeptidase [Verrucomicrobiae bacterium]
MRPVLLLLLLLCPRSFAEERTAGPLILPTENTALFESKGPAFYQVIERDFKGVKSRPWEGGQWGFVRNPTETPGGLVYSRFHEGIDIRPLRRAPDGEPLDSVDAIADGTVVYVNSSPRHSGYGKYIVVEHLWEGCPYYSLYAHLAEIRTSVGKSVKQGESLACMGYTGPGLDRSRAHLHFEIALMINRQFDRWFESLPTAKTDPNRHGLYNGMNLNGINVARYYLALRKDPTLSLPAFLATEKTYYKVLLPNKGPLDVVSLYPWLLADSPLKKPASWEVSFSQDGQILRVTPQATPVDKPTVSWVHPTPVPLALVTKSVLFGKSSAPGLTDYGLRVMNLIGFGN